MQGRSINHNPGPAARAMNTDGVPLFDILKSRLGYLSARETLIAQNVANADTPGYAAKDLKPFTLPPALGGDQSAAPLVEPTRTSPMHLAPADDGISENGFRTVDSPDSDTTLNGNQVVLEDEMAKLSDSRTDYQAVIGFYQKALLMITTAAKAPGK